MIKNDTDEYQQRHQSSKPLDLRVDGHMQIHLCGAGPATLREALLNPRALDVLRAMPGKVDSGTVSWRSPWNLPFNLLTLISHGVSYVG